MKHLFIILTATLFFLVSCGDNQPGKQPNTPKKIAQREGIQWGEIHFKPLEEDGYEDYQKLPWDEEGEWHWYMGVGGAAGYVAWADLGFFGAAGRVGIEYDFTFPMQISIDYRPVIGVAFNGAGAGCYWDLWGAALGLSIRYKF